MWKWFVRNWYYLVKYLVIALSLVLILVAYCMYPIENADVQNVQNNLIAVSGILAGIVLAFLSAQFFQLKQEREDRQVEINMLADKLSAFRNLLYRIMKSNKFWTKYDSITNIKKVYPDITYEVLHGYGEQSREVRNYILDQNDMSYSTIDLYLSMEALTGQLDNVEYWPFDRTIRFRYDIDYLYRIYDPTNQIWYFLEGRYAKHTHGLIDDQESAISVNYQQELSQLPGQIDSEYRDAEFSRLLVSSIAVDFYEEYIPELIRLTALNQRGVTGPVRTMLILLFIILGAGVILPLSGQLLTLDQCFEKYMTLSMVIVVIACLIHLIFDLFHMHSRELDVSQSENTRKRELVK